MLDHDQGCETFTLSDTEEPGDTSLRGAHKDSRNWKFECRREPYEAAQFLRRSLGFWHRRAGDDTSFEPSSVSQTIAACNHWTLPRSAAFRRYVDGMQKPERGPSLVAYDKARSSVWYVRTVDYVAALRKQLMDDSRHWVLPRTHDIQECRDLHLELQKVLGKRVCHAKSWNETSLPYMYNTLKSKCFDTSPSDSGRTCRKQGHSCLRKIISWAQRTFFRRASRACEILLHHFRVGWETKCLKVAVTALRAHWRRCWKHTPSATVPE